MNQLTFLELLNQYPLAGAMLLGLLMVVAYIVKAWKGGTDASRLEQENNRLAKQISETVNRCAERSHTLMASIETFMQANDVGHLSTEVKQALSLLAKMDESQGRHKESLDRVDRVCRDVFSHIERIDPRVVHATILEKIVNLEKLVEDVKRISIDTNGRTRS